MFLSELEFANCLPTAGIENRGKFYAPLTKAMLEYQIDTRMRIAAFLAQIAHESGNFHYVEEIASGKAYEMRKDLGNLEKEALDYAHQSGSTTGRFYKGRGLIQITGFYNYKDCGKALNLPLTTQPNLLLEPINACRSAAWFWNTHNCNNLADIGDFNAITKKINGGYNGLTERLKYYNHILSVI